MTRRNKGIKRLGPNRYQLRINRLDPKTGRKVNRKLIIEGTLDDAEKAYADLRAKVLATREKPQRVRLAVYARSWLERRVVKDSTRRSYGYALLNILEVLGDYYIDSLTPAMVQQYITGALQKRGWQTVRFELRVLRTIAKDAQADGLCERPFTDRVKEPKGASYTIDNPNLFTPEQFAEVFTQLRPRWKPMVLLMVTTGLRWGEASALQWEDVHEDYAVIKYTNYRGTLTDPKTEGSYRVVPILPEVMALLGLRKDSGPVFTTTQGTMHKAQAAMLRALKAAEKAAGITFKVTLHGLRRTFNNEARKRTSREVLMSLTGHDTHEMVEHYSVVATEEKAAASRAVLEAISVPKASRDDGNKGGKS